MNRVRRAIKPGTEGYVLLAVTVFALVLTIAGMGFFTMASYETKGAMYRQNSNEAFYLADGAIEMARGQFLKSRAWRPDSTATTTLGRGTYTLKSRDTTYAGYADVVKLTARGHVQNANRAVEVMAQVPPTAYSLGILVNGNVDNVHGSLDINGDVHVNGDPGGIAGHVSPGNTVTQAPPVIEPPPIYTDSLHFTSPLYSPVKNTYYVVLGDKTGPVAHIYKGGVEVTFGGHNLSGIVTYNNGGGGTFTYNFSATTYRQYFDETTGYYHRSPGTNAVVVNFGEPPLNPATAKTDLDLNGGTGSIHGTSIDTRFTGVTVQDRLNTNYWTGGTTTVKQVLFEPYAGVSLIGYDLDVDTQGFGSTAWPDLVYLTHDLIDTHGNSLLITGSLIVLHDFRDAHGNATINYSSGFVSNLPGYLRDTWPPGVAGTMKILRWKEIWS